MTDQATKIGWYRKESDCESPPTAAPLPAHFHWQDAQGNERVVTRVTFSGYPECTTDGCIRVGQVIKLISRCHQAGDCAKKFNSDIFEKYAKVGNSSQTKEEFLPPLQMRSQSAEYSF